MYYDGTTGIDYTTGLVIAGLLLVILWCLIKLEQRKEAKAREKMVNDTIRQMDDIQKKTEADENGFTLIELLVVVAIIGILVAIAIPQFSIYKKQAKDSAAQAQIKDMALAEEAYYAANRSYTTSLANLRTYGFIPMSGVTRTRLLVDKTGAASTTAYQLTATATGGTGKTFTWMSDNGGLQ